MPDRNRLTLANLEKFFSKKTDGRFQNRDEISKSGFMFFHFPVRAHIFFSVDPTFFFDSQLFFSHKIFFSIQNFFFRRKKNRAMKILDRKKIFCVKKKLRIEKKLWVDRKKMCARTGKCQKTCKHFLKISLHDFVSTLSVFF